MIDLMLKWLFSTSRYMGFESKYLNASKMYFYVLFSYKYFDLVRGGDSPQLGIERT